MRTNFVLSCTKMVTSLPASVVNVMVFPETVLIVPTGRAVDCACAAGTSPPQINNELPAPKIRTAVAIETTPFRLGTSLNAMLDSSLPLDPSVVPRRDLWSLSGTPADVHCVNH